MLLMPQDLIFVDSRAFRHFQLCEHRHTQSKVPEGYAFPSDPTLMQLYVAYKTKNLN